MNNDKNPGFSTGQGIKTTPSIEQILGLRVKVKYLNKESPVILYNLKSSSANKTLDIKTKNVLLT